MKKLNYLFFGLILASAMSCDKKEEESAVTIDDIVGSWKATSSVFTNNADPSEVADLIAIGGELRFTMLNDGGVRTWFELDTISDEWDSQAVITNNIMTLTPAEPDRGINTFEFELDNNTLELSNSSASFDFTLSGADEVPASSVTMFERN
jgi:hypothetical protein